MHEGVDLLAALGGIREPYVAMSGRAKALHPVGVTGLASPVRADFFLFEDGDVNGNTLASLSQRIGLGRQCSSFGTSSDDGNLHSPVLVHVRPSFRASPSGLSCPEVMAARVVYDVRREHITERSEGLRQQLAEPLWKRR